MLIAMCKQDPLSESNRYEIYCIYFITTSVYIRDGNGNIVSLWCLCS